MFVCICCGTQTPNIYTRCILSGFLSWICTENFNDFDADAIHAAVNSELYFYILLKIFLTFAFGRLQAPLVNFLQ
ncbi:hypothetical protein TcWFU_002346 [Taenia crassiceps]|uniref:Uncharacterized protein n=1 Tax=Taenia crassiceps TaxID=6207 RepID=A0ABR4QPT4_9CEST